MGIVYDAGTIFSTASADLSSGAVRWLCSGTAATDIMATTSVGLGHVTSGMVVVFAQVTGGTCAVGLTSGAEYEVGDVTTATSSFKAYAVGYSSAADISANSTGPAGDYAYLVRASSSIPTFDAKYAVVQVSPTTGWQGQFYFVGSQQGLDADGKLSTSNPFVKLAYQDLTATSYPAIGTTNVVSSGQSSTSFRTYRVEVAGMDYFAMRTNLHNSGGLQATAKLYRE